MAINKFFRAVAGYFFQGLLYLAPISITIYIIYYAFVYIDGLLDEYILEYLGFNIPGLGILIILISIALIGFILSSIIFRPLWHLIERLMVRAPLVKIIYTSVKDLMEDIQLRARHYWTDIDHPELGAQITYPGPFVQMSQTPITIDRRAPFIGEHNLEIYGKELGRSRETLGFLKAQGVI